MSQIHATTDERDDEMISAAVRGLMAQRRVSPAQVAMAAGVSRAALYRKLGNASPWQASEVSRLARFFDVSRDSLYEGRADFSSRSVRDYGSEVEAPHTSRPSRYGRRRSDRPTHLRVVA